MDTLNGGREVTVTNIRGETELIKVLQVPIRKYEAGFLKLDDEIGLTAFICDRPKEWAYDLTPESYEAVYQISREVNEKGFFEHARRRRQELIQQFNSMKIETLKETIKALNGSTVSPQGLRPRAA